MRPPKAAIGARHHPPTKNTDRCAGIIGRLSALRVADRTNLCRCRIDSGSFNETSLDLIEMGPVLPVFGPEAKLQLVYVGDVAEAVALALEHPETHGGHLYELGGPEQLSMMDINQRIAAATAAAPANTPNWRRLSAS